MPLSRRGAVLRPTVTYRTDTKIRVSFQPPKPRGREMLCGNV